MNEEDKSALLENLKDLDQSVEQLRYSLEKCKDIVEPFSASDLESIEALSARFARTADILTQKVTRSLMLYLREEAGTFIDLANRMEKLHLTESAQSVIEIRDLRNEIVHEYSKRDSRDVRESCIALASALLDDASRVSVYIKAL